MNTTTPQTQKAHQILNIIWGILTALFLIVAIFVIGKSTQNSLHEQLENTTKQLSIKIDKLINRVTQSVYSTTINTQTMMGCAQLLQPQLQHIVRNVPEIAGLSINEISHDSQKILTCSTFPADDLKLNNSGLENSLNILGPVQLKALEHPVLILRQQLGQYIFNIAIQDNDFQKLFKPAIPFAKFVVLYDAIQHKILIEMLLENSLEQRWLPANTEQINQTELLIKSNPQLLIATDLIRLNHSRVLIGIDNKQIKHLIIRNIAIASLILIILSLGLYYFIRHRIRQHFSLHRALMNAIRQGEFFPTYQPIMDRRTNHCCGAEVLLRWQSTENEIIMPDSFIEYTEESGLIVPITVDLVKKVFAESSMLLENNPAFYLAINISAAHFSDPYFFKTFITLCEKYHIAPQQIILEITERNLLYHDESVINTMQMLREKGYSLAIDDFGTGNSNISYLQRFPFNYLKIDRIFINSIGSGAITESLSLSMIEMANRLGLKVIAEGVETYTQLESLENNGAYLMQGWYFSKALPFESLISFLNRNNTP